MAYDSRNSGKWSSVVPNESFANPLVASSNREGSEPWTQFTQFKLFNEGLGVGNSPPH